MDIDDHARACVALLQQVNGKSAFKTLAIEAWLQGDSRGAIFHAASLLSISTPDLAHEIFGVDGCFAIVKAMGALEAEDP